MSDPHAAADAALRTQVRCTATGARLPAERVLAAQLGVGRAVVRSALKRLDANGLVCTLSQVGTVVVRHENETRRTR
ncbi:hypothetical protein GCM10010472_19730 [Pseudonocardia halophobica]|uniref:HTH gntR-type domain-containing protein n=1 Tax=Pseudonocardia halophobica TaxID=29401 RepID=A0A9W6KYS8_9PSEU|nr:GntR family transcriptional regulator [Pseudonocardia halophobica]GLL09813.1 hypothetical protein GCM10017577_09530 [Pseudonocardia halophobica]